MKRNKLTVVSIILSLVMAMSLVVGCGAQGDATISEEPKEQVWVLSEIAYKWVDGPKTMSVGDKITLDEYGRVVEIMKTYDSVKCQYDEEGILVRAEIEDKDDGTVGYESWTYTDGVLNARYRDPNDGTHSIHDVQITINKDASGRAIELIESITYIDPENGSKENEVAKYEYEYDGNGYVSVVRYYKNGKLDNTANLTYDENGNLVSCSHTGGSMGEYLRYDLKYEQVDADTVKTKKLEPFDYYQNLKRVFEKIL